jgi:transposase
MLPTVRRTWAPKGRTPILHHRTRSHKKVSTIGALSISPGRRRLGLYLHWHPDKNITATEVTWFLRDLLRHLRGHVILIWDRLNAHRSKQVALWRAVYPRLSIEWFPPYAPELNPIEYVWGYLKGHRLANHGLCELDAVYEQAQTEANDLAQRQSLLRSFVHASELPIRFAK